MSKNPNDLQRQIDELKKEVTKLKRRQVSRCVRKTSPNRILGMPVYDIAIGPDPEKNELRGHARGLIAIGDIATGVLALGGISRGLIAVGGVSLGGITLGGCSLGVLLGIGGVATGAIAVGGCALGGIAFGGMAIGYYAIGGSGFGQYVINATRQDAQAIRFFSDWIPGIKDFVPRRRH